MTNDFNWIAPFYDKLQRIVFGDSLSRSATFYFDKITSDHKVLILGGGTGKIIEKIDRGAEITFLDKSSVMMEKASLQKHPGLDLVAADFLKWKASRQFDFVVCPFFLDVFNRHHLSLALGKIHALLKRDGKLLVSDFQETGKTGHSILLRIMFLFFRVTVSLESKKLLSILMEVENQGFLIEETKEFESGFVFTSVFRKN